VLEKNDLIEKIYKN